MPQDCSRELYKHLFIFFFLSKRNEYRQKKPFPSKIVHSASIPWSLRHLPSFSIILRSIERQSFFFPILAERWEGNSIPRKPVLGTRAQWYGRSAEESRMRRFLYVDDGLSLSEVAGQVDTLLEYHRFFFLSLFPISLWSYYCFLKFNELCRAVKRSV